MDTDETAARTEENAMPSEENNASAPKRKRSFLKWYLLAVIAVLFVLCALIFRTPEKIPVSMLRMEDVLLQSMLINRMQKELRAQPPIQSATLRLTPENIASLLRIGDVASEMAILSGKYPGPAVRYFRVRQIGDALEVQFPFDTGLRFLFGGEIRLLGQFRVKKSGSVVTVQLLKLHIGDLPLPAFLVGTREIDLRKIKNGEELDRMLQSLSFDEKGNLTVVYSPEYAAERISDGLSGR